MGPIATNMNKVFNDILMVFYAYAVFFLASAAAFHLILNRIVFGNFENCDNDEVRQESQNREYFEHLTILFSRNIMHLPTFSSQAKLMRQQKGIGF